MLQVYNYMMLGLALTGIVAYVVGTTPALYLPIFGTPLKWVVMLAPLGVRILLLIPHPDHVDEHGPAHLLGILRRDGPVNGLDFPGLHRRQHRPRVLHHGRACSARPASTAIPPRPISPSFGSFLFMGLIGIVIASLVNLFIGSSALQFAVSVIGVIVFTGLAAYDTQTIKETYAENAGVEANGKLAVFGALSLYLSFINLFQMLLQLFGVAREE